MMNREQIEVLLKQSKLHLKNANKAMKTSQKGTVRYQINRDLKTACIAEINILKQVLNG